MSKVTHAIIPKQERDTKNNVINCINNTRGTWGGDAGLGERELGLGGSGARGAQTDTIYI
jgi:hypothetical protein